MRSSSISLAPPMASLSDSSRLASTKGVQALTLLRFTHAAHERALHAAQAQGMLWKKRASSPKSKHHAVDVTQCACDAEGVRSRHVALVGHEAGVGLLLGQGELEVDEVYESLRTRQKWRLTSFTCSRLAFSGWSSRTCKRSRRHMLLEHPSLPSSSDAPFGPSLGLSRT